MALVTILIEDNITIQNTLIPALEEMVGAQIVAVAGTALDGLQALQSHANWQLVVIDLFLKQGNGLEVLKACQSRHHHQLAVVITNFATNDVRTRCKNLGADAVFDKSTELDDFFTFCSEIEPI